MLIALSTQEQVLMLLGFAGMLAFMALAAWLWWRQQNPAQAASAARVPPAARSEPRAASTDPAPDPNIQPEAHEPTEFIALPGQRELDAPLDAPLGTEIVTAHRDDAQPNDELESPADKTAFVAPRLGSDSEPEPVERTAMIPSAELLARQQATQSRPIEAESPPDRTEFLAPPVFAAPITSEPSATMLMPAPAAVFEAPPVPAPPAYTSPKHVPTPPAPSTASPSPSLPSFDLVEHFSLAAEAFEQLQRATTAGSLEVWRGHLEVLGSIPGEQLHEQLRPELAGTPNHRWAAALLALLHNKTWAPKRAFGQLLTEFDAERRDAAMRVLRSWDDPRAQTIATAGLELGDVSMRATWLECFAERGWDPGAKTIEAALADSDPHIVGAGLRALPHCKDAPGLEPKLASHLFAVDPSVRAQAIETALLFANNSAWLICRQLARNPSFPVAAELVGLLGTPTDIDALRAALDTSRSPALLRGLGLSGRRVALDVCVARFDDEDLPARATARECLGHAAGRSFESATEARSWLDAHKISRLLGGAARTPAHVLVVLADADLPLRRTIARDLRVRSGGRLHLDVDTLPEAWRRQLDRLGKADSFAAIDFERGFPWAKLKAGTGGTR